MLGESIGVFETNFDVFVPKIHTIWGIGVFKLETLPPDGQNSEEEIDRHADRKAESRRDRVMKRWRQEDRPVETEI